MSWVWRSHGEAECHEASRSDSLLVYLRSRTHNQQIYVRWGIVGSLGRMNKSSEDEEPESECSSNSHQFCLPHQCIDWKWSCSCEFSRVAKIVSQASPSFASSACCLDRTYMSTFGREVCSDYLAVGE